MALVDLLPKYKDEFRRQLIEMEICYLKTALASEELFFLAVGEAIDRLVATCTKVRVLFDIDQTLVHYVAGRDFIRPSALAVMHAASEHLPEQVQFGLLSARTPIGVMAVRIFGQTDFPSHLFDAELISTAGMLPDLEQRQKALLQHANLLDQSKTVLYYLAEAEAAKLECIANILVEHEQDGLVYVDDAALPNIMQQGPRFCGVGVHNRMSTLL